MSHVIDLGRSLEHGAMEVAARSVYLDNQGRPGTIVPDPSSNWVTIEFPDINVYIIARTNGKVTVYRGPHSPSIDYITGVLRRTLR